MTFRQKAAAAALVAVVSFTSPAFAQSQLAAAEASAFIGDWELGLDTPQGSMTMALKLSDAAGKVAATLTADAGPVPGTTNITDIARDTDKLVLKYELDFQGMPIPAIITLVPVGEKWKANFDFAGGQFVVDGTAVKK
ncbi:MAG: hypothetical protein ABI665_14015 [Vicinamibacterales bacterium]